MGLPLIISFYTRDWIYPEHAARLRKECKSLGLDCRIEERPSAGTYLKNTCIKPFFIRDMLREEKRPVLWVDVDGSIYHKPVFFSALTCDFAAKRMAAARSRTWHVGTLWFNYTPAALEFLDQWCALTGKVSDESALDELWRTQPGLSVSDIPPEYFVLKPEGKKSAVIFHRLSTGPSKVAQRHLFAGTERKQKQVPKTKAQRKLERLK